MNLYPVVLKFDGRSALVVGAGSAAAMKLSALLEGGARVRVVAPRLAGPMREMICKPGVTWVKRGFVPGDLDGMWLAVGAADDPAINLEVFECARRRNILVNTVDDAVHSDFIFPAVLRRGNLVVTVSTSGVAPAFASRLRDYLASIIGEPFGRVLGDLAALRGLLKERYPHAADRRATWYRILDEHVMPGLVRGETPMLKHLQEKVDL
jgi:precorrin-2 dehydrogenase / sirohydrochlorin ferrochelatase